MHKNDVYRNSMALLCAAMLTACGGGGSSDGGETGGGSGGGSGSGGGATSTFVGVVADGYLVDATVCLDLNDNKACDAGEPSDTTRAGGAFSIDATQEQIDNNPVILVATAGVTSDEDAAGGTFVPKSFVLTAPAGSTFVSPLTTLVQAEIEANENIQGYTAADATAAVQTALGTSADLLEDYIAKEEAGGADAADFQRLHEIAQVATIIIADNLAAVETAATAQGSTSTSGDLFELVVAEVSEDLGVISEAVDADTATTFDPTAVVTVVEDEVEIDTVNLDDQVAQQELEETAVIGDVGALISSAGGLNWFYVALDYNTGVFEGLETGTLTYDTSTTVTTDMEYDVGAGGSLTLRVPGVQDFALSTSVGWVDDDEIISAIVLNSDGSVDWELQSLGGVTYSSEHVEGSRVDVSGQAIAPFIIADDGPFDSTTIVGSAMFSAGAEAYQLMFTSTTDSYNIWHSTDCSNVASLGGSCNSVWHQTGDGDFGTDTTAITMAAAIVNSAVDSNTVASNGSLLNALEIGYNPNLRVEMVTDNTSNFYELDFNQNGDAIKVGSSTWEQRTIGGAVVYLLDIPTSLRDQLDVDTGEKVLLTERNGFVRRGEFNPSSNVDSEVTWVFNSVGRQDVLANYSEPTVAVIDPDFTAASANSVSFVSGSAWNSGVSFGVSGFGLNLEDELAGNEVEISYLFDSAGNGGRFTFQEWDNTNTQITNIDAVMTWAIQGENLEITITGSSDVHTIALSDFNNTVRPQVEVEIVSGSTTTYNSYGSMNDARTLVPQSYFDTQVVGRTNLTVEADVLGLYVDYVSDNRTEFLTGAVINLYQSGGVLEDTAAWSFSASTNLVTIAWGPSDTEPLAFTFESMIDHDNNAITPLEDVYTIHGWWEVDATTNLGVYYSDRTLRQ